MTGFNMTLLGEFHTILYDEEPLPASEYLKGIPKAILLKLATFTIGLDPNVSKLYDWRELLNMWFRKENEEFKRKIWQRCIALEANHNTKVSLLSPIASLRLFETAFSLTSEEALQDPIESEITLFKAYLTFLTNEANKDAVSDNYLKQIEGKYRVAATLFNQTYPLSDFTNYVLVEVFVTQLSKAFFLFEFLSSRSECDLLMKEFYAKMGLNGWKDYFQFIVPLIEAHSKHPSEGWTEVDVVRNKKFDASCFFLEAISLKNFDSELDPDFKLLRGNPIYKVDEGRYAIISPLFLFEKIFKGLYFKLKEVYDSLPIEQKMIKNFRSFYTSNFSENYLLYQILNYIYSGRNYIRHSGEELSNMGVSGAPDYYIRNGKIVFLFENKDVFINANIKQSFDFKRVEEELKKKFYSEVKDGKIAPKAVLQLISNVAKILSIQNSFDKNYKSGSLKIYPILILQDSSFNAPGLNYILNDWFQEKLKDLESSGLNVSKVKPITIINIDTLIMYTDYLKLKKVALNTLIDKYIVSGRFNEKKSYKNFEELKAAYGKSLLSFSFFIDQYTEMGFDEVPMKFRQLIMSKIFPKEI